MNWHKIPEFETVSSAADDNPFAGARVQPTGKGRPDGMGCMLRRAVRVQQYAPGHRILPNSTTPSAGLHAEIYLLPHPPRPSVRTCSGVGREQHVNRQ